MLTSSISMKPSWQLCTTDSIENTDIDKVNCTYIHTSLSRCFGELAAIVVASCLKSHGCC